MGSPSSSDPRALMQAALARCGFPVDEDDPIDDPIVALCEAAKLTPFEYEAVAMSVNGLSDLRIGGMHRPRRSEESVRAAYRRGRGKLLVFLSASDV